VPSAKPVVKKHLERTVNFSWSQILEDPRSKINLKWNFDYVINTAFFSMLTGQLDLRKVEDFSENFEERISDTLFHLLLPKIDAEPLRKLIADEVKKAHRNHELLNNDFPIILIAIDGKCSSISKQSVGLFSQKSECNGGVHYLNRVLRAAIVSSKTVLILGQREIHGKTSESTEFIPFMQELISMYGKTNLLGTITVDAGMNALKNADFLVDNGNDYIMALKNPQKKLVELGHKLLVHREKCDKETIEYGNGKIVKRQLFRCSAPEGTNWSHLKQFWRIRQETKNEKGIAVEDRYFITSLDVDILSDAEVMKAIRMHWGIENNANWVFDTAWEEDDSPWCNKAFVFVTLMRILAYNINSRLKERRLRKKNDRERSWKGILQMIYIVLIEMKHELKIEVFATCEV
jgi:predicted transposase YbfD/YdcC